MTDVLKDAIRASEVPLSKVAELADVPIPSLTRFMRGERSISLPVAEKLIRLLGVQVSPPPASARNGKAKAE